MSLLLLFKFGQIEQALDGAITSVSGSINKNIFLVVGQRTTGSLLSITGALTTSFVFVRTLTGNLISLSGVLSKSTFLNFGGVLSGLSGTLTIPVRKVKIAAGNTIRPMKEHSGAIVRGIINAGRVVIRRQD